MANIRTRLEQLLAQRILVLDGAMGTMIQRHKLTEEDFRGERFTSHPRDLRGNNDMLVLTRPDIILAIHEEYLQAGSDIIETNSFSGTTIAQADYQFEPLVYELNFEAAKLARQAVDKWSTPDKPRFVAGAIGPTNKTLSISPDVNDPAFRAITFDQMKAAFAEQTRALIDGGADVLLIETIIDTLSAKAALVAAAEVDPEGRVPLILSATITDRSGRMLAGQTIDAFWVSIAHAKPLIVGMKVPPNYGPTYARTFDALFVDVAKAHRTPVVPYVFEGFGEDLALFQGDRIHPTAAAQTRILDNVWPVLVPLLARK